MKSLMFLEQATSSVQLEPKKIPTIDFQTFIFSTKPIFRTEDGKAYTGKMFNNDLKTLTRRSWPWVDGQAQPLNCILDPPEVSELKLQKEWQKLWRMFNINVVDLISELSDLSELDEYTITIEDNVRKELPKPAKREKTKSKTPKKKATRKEKTMEKELAIQADAEKWVLWKICGKLINIQY